MRAVSGWPISRFTLDAVTIGNEVLSTLNKQQSRPCVLLLAKMLSSIIRLPWIFLARPVPDVVTSCLGLARPQWEQVSNAKRLLLLRLHNTGSFRLIISNPPHALLLVWGKLWHG